MKKSTSGKKIETDKKAKESPDKQQPDVNKSNDNEHPLDFGGLPPRDLKKNLGCG